LRENRRVSADSGAVETTTVPANSVMSRPTRDSLTFSSSAMSGSRPVGRNSLVTEVKIAAAITIRATQGNELLRAATWRSSSWGWDVTPPCGMTDARVIDNKTTRQAPPPSLRRA
jgi:hypothetical protein